jgi:sugar phosphate isomerase/epimerase
MPKAIEARTYEEALAWLREHGFDVTEAPGTNGRVFLRKYNVSAAIQKTADDGVKIFAYPGYLRDLEAGQPRLPAVFEELEDGNPGVCRPPQSAAVVCRRAEDRAWAAQPLQ